MCQTYSIHTDSPSVFANKMLLALLLVFCLTSSGYNQIYPSSALLPNNTITDVSFTCDVSTPEWRVNGTVLTFGNIPPEITTTSLNGIPALTFEKGSVLRYNGTSVQCRQHDGENWSSIPTASIRVFGTRINCLAQYVVYKSAHSCYCFVLQVLPQGQLICHQSQYQMVYWCSAGLLHGLLMGYS